MMNSKKNWGSALIAAALLTATLSAAQAEPAVPSATIAQAGDAGPAEGNEAVNPSSMPDQPADAGQPGANPATVSDPQATDPAAPASEDQTKLRNLAAGLTYEWSEAPDVSRPDGGNKLTDGKYGKLDMNDPAWVGHVRGKTREVVFDLGEEKSIGKIKAHFLQDYPANSILVPLTVSMYVSDDKENWGLLSHNATQLLWGEGPPRQETFEWDAAGTGSKAGIRTASWPMPVT
ncbi:hypothetical protein CM49_02541 [Paenibacillus sp. P1XP2]|nr:hypothetical protein CM49_02541 [Paenibacillus sp. P1XP2]